MNCVRYLVLLVWALNSWAHAQESPLPSVEQVEKAVAVLANEDASTPKAKEIQEATNELLASLKTLAEQSTLVKQFTDNRQSIKGQLEAVSKESGKAYEAPQPSESASLEDLSAKARSLDQARQAAAASLQDLNSESARRSDRLAQLPTLIIGARTELDRLTALPAGVPDQDPELALRQRQLRQANRETQATKLAALEAEASYYNESSELLNAQIALAELKVERRTNETKAWQQAVAKARSADARAIAEEAATRAANTERHPYLRKLDREVLELAEQRIGPNGTTARLNKTSARKLEIESQHNELKQQFSDSQEQLSFIKSANLDLGEMTGKLLLKLRQELPNLRFLRTELQDTAKHAALLFIENKALEEEIRSGAGNKDAAVAEGFEKAQAVQAIPEAERTAIENDLRGNIDLYRKLLLQLQKDKEALRSDLASMTVDLQGLIGVIEKFRFYIDESIPWLRSQSPWSLNQIGVDMQQSTVLLDKNHLQVFSRALPNSVQYHRLLWVGFVLLVVALYLKRPRLKASLTSLAEEARLRTCSNFRITLKAVGITALLSLPFALLVWFPAWTLSHAESHSFIETVLYLSRFILFFSLLYQTIRPHGLAEAHLDMNEDACARIRKLLRWFVPVFLVAVAIVQLYRRTPSVPALDGRTFYILQMLLLSIFLFQCLRILLPSRLGKFQRIFFVALTLAIPFGLTYASLSGYHYAVIELEKRLRLTVWISLGSLFLFMIIKRGIVVSRRRLRRQELLASRALRRAESEGTELEPQELIDEQSPDASTAQRQSDRLIRAIVVVLVTLGLWGVWSDLLPALKVLDRVTVWPAATQPVSSSEAASADVSSSQDLPLPLPSETTTTTPTPSKGISLADILVSLAAFFLTYVAVRNIPGLLEVAVLQHIQLRRGSSYAISTVVRYIIVVIGLLIGFGALGISWSNVHWLAAAVSLGIGFGLQEIFANFVAGLILLFERPMRVGDVVSVGETSGKVTQIRMRATTITSFNKQELVVPNKSFITSEFINWTLTDSVLRTEVIVGVAYGSDVNLVKETLTRVAEENPLVMDDPEPDILFTDFGASTLDFELRLHVQRVADLPVVRSELRFAINKAFAEAGIEIAFPQLDVHLKGNSEPCDYPAGNKHSGS